MFFMICIIITKLTSSMYISYIEPSPTEYVRLSLFFAEASKSNPSDQIDPSFLQTIIPSCEPERMFLPSRFEEYGTQTAFQPGDSETLFSLSENANACSAALAIALCDRLET